MNRIVLTIIFFAALPMFGQPAPNPHPQLASDQKVATPKSPYSSDKVQLSVKQETILQLTANSDQKAFQDNMKDLQSQWQTEEEKILAWITDVKKTNGWDDTYTYDRVNDKWTHAPKPSEAPKK